MNRIVFLKLQIFLRLAHQNEEGRCTTKQRVARSLVGLPCCNKMTQSLLENILVDLDICHDVERIGDGRFAADKVDVKSK